MRTNHVKETLGENGVSYGSWLGLPSPLVARLTARAGFDWLMVDMEHSPMNFTMMAEIVGAIADAHGPAPFVRVPSFSVENTKRVLDSGAWGVLIPMVNTPEEAAAIVSSCKYPPEGTRSLGGMFAPLSFDSNRAEYSAEANKQIMVAIQIESRQGLDNVDKILSTPGLDIAFIGPNDLHASLGLRPSYESTEPLFLEAVATIRDAALRHNVIPGVLASSGVAARQWVQQGFRFVGITSDATSLLAGLSQNLKAAREEAN